MGMLNILLKSMSEDNLRSMSRNMERKMKSLDYESKKHTRISTRHIDVVNEIASRSAGKLPKREHGWYLPNDD